jgi:hypothetical protein
MLENPQMLLSYSSSAWKSGPKFLQYDERLLNNYRKRLVGVFAAKGGTTS